MRVEPVEDSPEWEPNAPEARLIADDFGRAALALRAHPSDSDSRLVVLVWQGVRRATIGGPNDEGLHQHPMYELGLRELLWMGRVVGGEGQHWI